MRLRSRKGVAMECDGYISGETLRDVADPCRYVVLSTWNNREAWLAWSASEKRREMVERLTPMLVEQEQVRVLEPA